MDFPLYNPQSYQQHFNSGLPVYWPWLEEEGFLRVHQKALGATVVSADRCYILYRLVLQTLLVPGEVWECGVYRGGTAAMIAETLHLFSSVTQKTFRLFDTFEGMPATMSGVDIHQKGDFSDTSLEGVRQRVGDHAFVSYHPGFLPGTFSGLEEKPIAFAHVDVDIYQSVWDCCAHIFPRLALGGFMVFDDYGFNTCPGARKAVDDYFRQWPVFPIVLPTGQALVAKSLPIGRSPSVPA